MDPDLIIRQTNFLIWDLSVQRSRESNPVLLRCAELRSFEDLRCPAACHHICDDSHQHQRMDLKVRCDVLWVTNCGRIPSQKTVMCVSQGFQRAPVFTTTTGMVCHSRSIALTSASVTYSNARALAAFSGQLSWGWPQAPYILKVAPHVARAAARCFLSRYASSARASNLLGLDPSPQLAVPSSRHWQASSMSIQDWQHVRWTVEPCRHLTWKVREETLCGSGKTLPSSPCCLIHQYDSRPRMGCLIQCRGRFRFNSGRFRFNSQASTSHAGHSTVCKVARPTRVIVKRCPVGAVPGQSCLHGDSHSLHMWQLSWPPPAFHQLAWPKTAIMLNLPGTQSKKVSWKPSTLSVCARRLDLCLSRWKWSVISTLKWLPYIKYEPMTIKIIIPSRKLRYPTWGKGKSTSNMPYQGDILIPWGYIYIYIYVYIHTHPFSTSKFQTLSKSPGQVAVVV